MVLLWHFDECERRTPYVMELEVVLEHFGFMFRFSAHGW